jgi:uncharacterized protein YlxW (UPF0749 family)
MTERIQHSMNEIRAKALEIHNQLVQERIKNQTLQAQIQEMEERLQSAKHMENEQLAAIDQLKLDLDVAKNQIVEVSVPQNGRNEEQIDELVKEIEYCIGQLKK